MSLLFDLDPGPVPRGAVGSAPDPPPTRRDSLPRPAGCDAHVDVARRLVAALLAAPDVESDVLGWVEAVVDDDVDVWTPAFHTASRFDLVASMIDADDAIGDVTVRFADAVGAGDLTWLAWVATGRFARPTFDLDDRLLEPTGTIVRIAGAAGVTFTDAGRVRRVRCYYDRQAIADRIDAAGVR